jgi:hypothetical protein
MNTLTMYLFSARGAAVSAASSGTVPVPGEGVPSRRDAAETRNRDGCATLGGRDALIEAMAAKGISCGIHYPVPVHLQEAYASLGLREGSFPVAERFAGEVVSLPMYPELTAAQVDLIAAEVGQWMKNRGAAS